MPRRLAALLLALVSGPGRPLEADAQSEAAGGSPELSDLPARSS